MSRDKRSGGPIGGLLKGAGFVIGLATEVHANNKAKKVCNQGLKQQEPPKIAVHGEMHPGDDVSPPTYDEVITFSGSIDSKISTKEEKQPLDTLVPHARKSPYEEKPVYSDKTLYVDTPIKMQPLPFPVIVPQRRPNDKSRGFARAYAPDLAKYKGIDEATFLNFLKQFHKSSQASGWFTVINIAAMGAGFAPGVIALAVTTSVQVAATVGAEAQRRYRTNSYLDKANEELFHPRNLHCMVMTFKPEASDSAVLSVGTDNSSSAGPSALSKFTSNMSNASNVSSTSGGSSSFSKFRKSDGVTEGEFAIPQAAELVFPSPTAPGETTPPDSTITDDNGVPIENPQKKKESSWKSTGKFLADYQDRRAQAKFAATYGDDSKLAVPGAADPSRFASKFSDPNANPLDFLSAARGGGRDRDRSRSRSRSRDDRWRGDDGYDMKYEDGRYPDERRDGHRDRSQGRDRDRSRDGRGGSGGGLIGGVKGFLKQDLLYLLIAEIPSEEEMRRLM